ncbi:MAG: hypothetical protein IH958_06800 [Chloroflexi bacterium]|nr:hypothetical protein [Chloroflexota bacterium]
MYGRLARVRGGRFVAGKRIELSGDVVGDICARSPDTGLVAADEAEHQGRRRAGGRRDTVAVVGDEQGAQQVGCRWRRVQHQT